MQRRRQVPGAHRANLSDSLSRLALLSAGTSSLRQSDVAPPADVDADLAELKKSWSWNFAGAPRTNQQEDKQWFQPQSTLRARHRPGAISCARCGQPLRINEVISHQADCLGEREPSSDEDESTGFRPRWKGPLDKEKAKPTRKPVLSDFLADLDFDDFDDFDDMDFSHLGARTMPGARGAPFSAARSSAGLPRTYGGCTSAAFKQASRSSASSSNSSYTGADFGRSRASSGAAPPPRKPPSPPQRPIPPSSRTAPVATPSSTALDNALAAHEGSWGRFDAAQVTGIRYGDVPWPDHSKTASDTLLVQHALQKATEAGDVKAALRKLQLRWHPDKWAQRFASKLLPDDAHRILTRVKEIAQIVNGLKAST